MPVASTLQDYHQHHNDTQYDEKTTPRSPMRAQNTIKPISLDFSICTGQSIDTACIHKIKHGKSALYSRSTRNTEFLSTPPKCSHSLYNGIGLRFRLPTAR